MSHEFGGLNLAEAKSLTLEELDERLEKLERKRSKDFWVSQAQLDLIIDRVAHLESRFASEFTYTDSEQRKQIFAKLAERITSLEEWRDYFEKVVDAYQTQVKSLQFKSDYILDDLPSEKNSLDELLKDVPGTSEPFDITQRYSSVPNPGIGQWQFRDQMKNYKVDGKKEKE